MRLLLYKLYSAYAYRLKLRPRLLLSYFVLILLPLVLFIILSSNHVSKSLIKQSQYSANISLRQTSLYIDRILSDISDLTEALAFNSSLGNILTNPLNAALTPDSYADYLAANQIVESMFKSRDLYSMEIFIEPDVFYAAPESQGIRGVLFSSRTIPFAQEVQNKLDLFHGTIMWMPARPLTNTLTKKTNTVITGARYMKENDNFSNIGIITVNMLQSDLNNIVGRANSFKNSLSFLMDSSGNVISASDEQLLEKYPVESQAIADEHNGSWSKMTVNGENILLGSYALANADWRLVSVLPYSEVLETSTDARNRMLLIMLLIATLAYFAAYFVARTMTGKISALISRMKEVQSGNFSTITSVKGNDEMSELAKNYNYMLEKINEYAKKQYELGLEVKNADLKALQAQINPHFLYNTLDLVNLIALENGVAEIPDIVKLLSTFYKLSLNKGLDIVSVRHEIAHIETYVKLQNYRFSNTIRLHLDIEPAILDCGMLKLLLQPIVENSILHGIFEKPSKSGMITITGRLQQGVLLLTIADDGVGMTKEQLTQLTDTEAVAPGEGGYGIRNVINRIKLCYGNEFGLHYESEAGEGTVAILQIPPIDIQP
ncbi:MAG: yesM1 [Paenibacillaceae bacterium]|jgi:two-component system sensor histidine kinase YesM|nr:yesM1 [Paenibacillaceae bacterium]